LTTPPGVEFKQEEIERLRNSFDAMYSGNANTAVLTNGMEAKVIGMSAADAQYLETRRFQVEEIARIYRIPPHMIGDLERATFSNIEQQAQSFIDYTLRPWLTRWEQAMNRDLLKGHKDLYFEFLVDGLLRGDTAARSENYRRALGNTNNGEPAWMTVEEVREKENLPIEPTHGELVRGNENQNSENQNEQTNENDE